MSLFTFFGTICQNIFNWNHQKKNKCSVTKSPLQYFKRYISLSSIDGMVHICRNLYANVPFREIQNIQNCLSHAKASFAKQGAFFREIRNSFRMKFSRIWYERNSSVNPNPDPSDINYRLQKLLSNACIWLVVSMYCLFVTVFIFCCQNMFKI